MRHSRIFLRAEGTHFHVVSRVVGREFLLGEKEKAQFHKLMRRLEKSSGVQVLTYCLMDNHVHLLLRTEEIDRGAISDEDLVGRVGRLYSKTLAEELERKLDTWRKKAKLEGKSGSASASSMHQFWRDRYLERLGNLSEFMRVLKTSFSKWYNKEHERCGTLWEDRYKVVLVEGSEAVLVKVAAYIDLNPVRAGMVADPREYRWSGYGEACGGGVEARRGLTRVTGADAKRGWRDAGPSYRLLLDFEGVERRGRESAPGTKVKVRRDRHGREVSRVGNSPREGEREFRERGELGLRELLDRQVRYLVDGAVIGTRVFVDRVFNAQPAEKRGKRKTGARKMRGGDWGDEGLYSLRDLRKDVIGERRSPGAGQ